MTEGEQPSFRETIGLKNSRELDVFEERVREDQFDPFPISIMPRGHEVRLSYSPADFSGNATGEVIITGIGRAPEDVLFTLADHFHGQGVRIRMQRYDGRSQREEIEYLPPSERNK